MNPINLLYWGVVLFFQNFAFTYVSRARSSGSITRHAKASLFSNGIWIFSQMLMLGPMFDYLTGKHGHFAQGEVAAFYTVLTMCGSLAAHYWALRTEKGKNAVGASKLYAQVPVAEWKRVQNILQGLDDASGSLPGSDAGLFATNSDGAAVIARVITDFDRVKKLAEEAHVCAVGALPVSKVQAGKIEGQMVVAGLPEDPDPSKYMTKK